MDSMFARRQQQSKIVVLLFQFFDQTVGGIEGIDISGIHLQKRNELSKHITDHLLFAPFVHAILKVVEQQFVHA